MGYRDFVPTLTFLVSEAIDKVATDQKLMSLEGRDRLMQIERLKRRVIVVDLVDMQKYRDDLSSIDAEALKAGYSGAVVTRESGSVRSSSPRGMGPEGMDMERGGFRRPPISEASTPEQTSADIKPAGQRGYLVYLAGSTPLPYGEAARFLGELGHKLGELAGAFPSVDVTISVIVDVKRGLPPAAPSGTGGTPGLAGGEYRERGGVPSARGKDDINLDPLTGEYTGADTQFVLGWKVVIKDNGLPKDDQADSASKAGGAR